MEDILKRAEELSNEFGFDEVIVLQQSDGSNILRFIGDASDRIHEDKEIKNKFRSKFNEKPIFCLMSQDSHQKSYVDAKI